MIEERLNELLKTLAAKYPYIPFPSHFSDVLRLKAAYELMEEVGAADEDLALLRELIDIFEEAHTPLTEPATSARDFDILVDAIAKHLRIEEETVRRALTNALNRITDLETRQYAFLELLLLYVPSPLMPCSTKSEYLAELKSKYGNRATVILKAIEPFLPTSEPTISLTEFVDKVKDGWTGTGLAGEELVDRVMGEVAAEQWVVEPELERETSGGMQCSEVEGVLMRIVALRVYGEKWEQKVASLKALSHEERKKLQAVLAETLLEVEEALMATLKGLRERLPAPLIDAIEDLLWTTLMFELRQIARRVWDVLQEP